MCIRDSLRMYQHVIGHGVRIVLGKGQENDLASLVVHTIQTVSYTHLRAHETVLDLVCRLLLEKKKPPLILIRHIIQLTIN